MFDDVDAMIEIDDHAVADNGPEAVSLELPLLYLLHRLVLLLVSVRLLLGDLGVVPLDVAHVDRILCPTQAQQLRSRSQQQLSRFCPPLQRRKPIFIGTLVFIQHSTKQEE